MRTLLRDPISGRDVIAADQALYLIEGNGPDAIKIYFESETNRMKYLAITVAAGGIELDRKINNEPGSTPMM
jgi:hypothetical protein